VEDGRYGANFAEEVKIKEEGGKEDVGIEGHHRLSNPGSMSAVAILPKQFDTDYSKMQKSKANLTFGVVGILFSIYMFGHDALETLRHNALRLAVNKTVAGLKSKALHLLRGKSTSVFETVTRSLFTAANTTITSIATSFATTTSFTTSTRTTTLTIHTPATVYVDREVWLPLATETHTIELPGPTTTQWLTPPTSPICPESSSWMKVGCLLGVLLIIALVWRIWVQSRKEAAEQVKRERNKEVVDDREFVP
jgi:hypothetical protein